MPVIPTGPARRAPLLLRLALILPCLLGVSLAAAPARAASAAQRSLDKSLGALFAKTGGSHGGLVRDLNTGATLYSLAPNTGRLPASVEKLYTTSTALLRMGPSSRLSTGVYGIGSTDASGTFRGTLYLRGGGDPTFGSASYDNYAYGTGAKIETLVANLKHAGITAVRGKVIGDETYFDRDRGTPATGNALSSDVEGELSGLAYDRGFTDAGGDAFQAQPALFAAQQLVFALRDAGIAVPKGTPLGTGPTPRGAPRLATVASPALSTLIELTNSPSDNFFAETLVKDLGARYGGAGTTAAGASIVRSQMASSFGIRPTVLDGSGLSRSDSTSPHDIVTALTGLAQDKAFTGSLAIAGVRGTMQAGLAGTYAAKRCIGKTGTLHDVANLAGYCTARDGHRLAYAFLLSGIGDSDYGHALEYSMAVALARYSG